MASAKAKKAAAARRKTAAAAKVAPKKTSTPAAKPAVPAKPPVKAEKTVAEKPEVPVVDKSEPIKDPEKELGKPFVEKEKPADVPEGNKPAKTPELPDEGSKDNDAASDDTLNESDNTTPAKAPEKELEFLDDESIVFMEDETDNESVAYALDTYVNMMSAANITEAKDGEAQHHKVFAALKTIAENATDEEFAQSWATLLAFVDQHKKPGMAFNDTMYMRFENKPEGFNNLMFLIVETANVAKRKEVLKRIDVSKGIAILSQQAQQRLLSFYS